VAARTQAALTFKILCHFSNVNRVMLQRKVSGEGLSTMVGAAPWGERGAGDREVAGSNPTNPARSCGRAGCLRNPSGRWLGVASAVCGIPPHGG
jgi:hypothetical protein